MTIDYFKLLRVVEINPTELCNLTCNFCPRSTFYPNKNIHMDLDLARLIRDQLQQFNYSKTISITGRGEPTLHPRFEELVDIFANNKWTLKINTNGKRFDRYRDIILGKFGEIIYNCYEHTQQEVAELRKQYRMYRNIRFRYKPKEESWITNIHPFTNRAGSFPTNWIPEDKRCDYVFLKTFIDIDGTYRLCCEDWKERVSLGNIQETNIYDYINNSELLKSYRKDLANLIRDREPCRSCTYQVPYKDLRFDKIYSIIKDNINNEA